MYAIRSMPVRSWQAMAALTFVAAGLAAQVPSRNSVRHWGLYAADTEVYSGRVAAIAASANSGFVMTDGRVFVQGGDGSLICRPPTGLPYVDIELSSGGCGFGLLLDGSVVSWGGYLQSYQLQVPPLPTGLWYTQVAAGYNHALFLRVDGSVVATGDNWFGQTTVPVVAPGTWFTKIAAREDHSLALLSNGDLVAWGDNQFGQCNVPTAVASNPFIDVAAGMSFCMALRSDGTILAWGSNQYGQCNVPALPPGTRYEQFSAGFDWAVAWRSDGTLVGWGTNLHGASIVPATPAGVTCREIAAGGVHGLVRWSDGTLSTWGYNGGYTREFVRPWRGPGAQSLADCFVGAAAGYTSSFFLRRDGTIDRAGPSNLTHLDAPTLPSDVIYRRVEAGNAHVVALRSDGQVACWGENPLGQLNVPPLPPGLTYVDISAAPTHTAVLRSDGVPFVCGYFFATLPAPPAGMSYTKIDSAHLEVLLLRSDGMVVRAGTGAGQAVPTLPAGVVYTDLGAGWPRHSAIRSDGQAVVWPPTLTPMPALPFGVYYVEADSAGHVVYLRRSDGEVVMVTNPASAWAYYEPPALEPGTSYLEIDCFEERVVGRIGSTCAYVGVAPGCAGTMQGARLVPRDTPRIATEFAATLFDLPLNAALLVSGLARTVPLDLGVLGAPGCLLHVRPDAVMFLGGQDNQARFSFVLPNVPALVGQRFYQQGVVLDPATNALGVVASDTMEGVIGYW